MTQLATGVPPPPFTLPNQDGHATSLSDFAGRHVLGVVLLARVRQQLNPGSQRIP